MSHKLKNGSLRKRKDGRWEARFTIDKKRFSVYGRTQKECIEKFKNAIKNPHQTAAPLALAEWLKEWYTVYKLPQLRPSSLRSIKTAIEKYICPAVGSIKFKDLTPLILQKFLNDVGRNRTCDQVAKVLSAALSKATKLGYIKSNPMLHVEAPKHTSESRLALTVEQQKMFIDYLHATKHKMLNLFLFYIATGCRRGEALGLTWDDIDLKNKIITISKSMNNDATISETKTKSSNRRLPISEPLLKILQELPQSATRVFNFLPNHVTKSFVTIVRHFGWKNISLHSLRHTFATRALESGIPMKVVQAWLGHSTYNMTANLYSHVTNDLSMGEMVKFDPMIDPPHHK